MRLLDRYLLRSFLLPFTYCLLGFFSVWLVFDLGSNAPSFIENRVALSSILFFYLSQVPNILVITLPVGLLLALLYSLGRMSQANEILAMLSAGTSLGRILTPFFAVGLAVTAASTALNYQLVPQAEAQRDQLLNEMEAGQDKIEKNAYTIGHLFRNRRDNRLWYVEKMANDLGEPLRGVQVVQQDAANNIIEKIYADAATYDEANQQWLLEKVRLVKYDSSGDVIAGSQSYPPKYVIKGWSETPWRIASSTLEADKLTVPQLREYLRLNADFTSTQLAPFRTYLYYRWALPWSCLVVVFISAPLGIVYSRRSVLTGVASSIFIFFLILFLTNLCLSLGKGDRISAFWAAWMPNFIFAFVGMVLLRVRALNRDRLPLTPARLWDFLTAH